MKNKKKILIISSIIIGIIVLALAASYALFRLNVTKNSKFVVAVGNLELRLEDGNGGQIILNNLEPSDEATALTKPGYNFTLRNTGKIDAGYEIYLDEVTPNGETNERISDDLIWVNITNTTTNTSKSYKLSELTSRMLEDGILNKNSHNDYVLRIWLDLDATNSEMNKYFAAKLRVEGTQSNAHDFAALILKNNTVRTEPIDTTQIAPLLDSYSDGELSSLHSNTMSSEEQSYYYTYSDSYTFDPATGYYELVDPQICKYSECYETLKGKYIASLYGSTTNTLNYSNYAESDGVYKVASSTTLYKLYFQSKLNKEIYDHSKDGLYAINVTDGYGGANGTTYIFRGGVENNKVRFANLDWRIIRINEDRTVRLILLEDESNHSAFLNTDGNDYNSMYYSNSDIKTAVEEWYSDKITGEDAKKVAAGNYFCEAAKVKDESNYDTGNAIAVEYENYTPDLKCVTDGNGKGIVNSNVGFLTADELLFAGGVFYGENFNYYLYGTEYWTMTPSGVNESLRGSEVWYSYDGTLHSTYVSVSEDFCPVINVKSDIDVTYDSATGTYIIN